jgi:hypothetical protein
MTKTIQGLCGKCGVRKGSWEQLLEASRRVAKAEKAQRELQKPSHRIRELAMANPTVDENCMINAILDFLDQEYEGKNGSQ